ncbi:MAG: F0F1 ATP synthase subunit A [Cytophagaceae bacterium]
MISPFKKISILAFILLIISNLSFANNNPKDPFKPGEMIMHHIGDSHEWEFAHGIAIPLPVILYSEKGIDMFSSSKFHNEKEEYNGYKLDPVTHEIIWADSNDKTKIYDISITKNVASLFLSATLLILVFTSVARGYKKNHGKAPRGIQSFFEPIVVYVRDDVAKKVIGPKYERFLPYLLTVFFFIWFNNLLGLIPGGANLTGNIAVTAVLALLTFIITLASSNGTYWKHILWTPGVPLILRVIILPIEIVGMFTKPFSLMIRLFANITAGHIIILSLFALIFIFESYTVGVVSTAFAVFMSLLELFVALLQAYVFTLLSAMYFASAVEEHHEDAHGHEEHPEFHDVETPGAKVVV